MKREKMVSIYFTKEEHEALLKLIAGNPNGYQPTLSSYIRSVMLKMIKPQIPSPVVPQEASQENKSNQPVSKGLHLGDLFNL